MKIETKLLTCIVLLFSGITIAATPEASTADEMSSYKLVKLWETNGFSEPESVFTFPGHRWLYVSNPNGQEPGYVSRITRQGTVDDLRWAEGFKLPTGMAHYNGDLFVVDLTRVVQVNLETGAIVKELTSDIDENGNGPNGTPVTLNDVAISADGTLYVTALGAGLYINQGDKLVAWSSVVPGAGIISMPNGIAAGDSALYVGSMGKSFEAMGKGQFGPIMKFSYADGSSAPIVGEDGPFAGWDGLDFFKDGVIASSPPTGDVWYIANGRGSLVGNVGVDNQISDTGLDAEAGILYAPMLRSNKVIAYKLTGYK